MLEAILRILNRILGGKPREACGIYVVGIRPFHCVRRRGHIVPPPNGEGTGHCDHPGTARKSTDVKPGVAFCVRCTTYFRADNPTHELTPVEAWQ